MVTQEHCDGSVTVAFGSTDSNTWHTTGTVPAKNQRENFILNTILNSSFLSNENRNYLCPVPV